jgi:phthiocerol/phenolphthiocerol synthesis type-I polyketide synthase A
MQDENELRHWLIDYLVTNIGCNPDDVDPEMSLNDLGVGSRDAVVLSGELSELLGRPVSPVEFWQHPSVNALAHFLTTAEASAAEAAPAAVERDALDEQIAVIGLGCRFPGDISGPDALWQFVSDGGSAISEVPADRWPAFDDGSPESAAALARTTRWGGFLSEIDTFDAEFFEISPSEAARIDPQQRILLEVAWEALEHAGIPANSLRHTQTGVFAGACLSEYGYLASTNLGEVDAWTGTGGALSIIANRLSYFLDVRGPSVVVDTACSSSLVAIHLACQSLRTGDSNLALAAGVNLLLSPAVTRSFDAAEAMSPTGACHAFDASADGFVRGEGCGVVVLKRLSDALNDGDRVLAVVRGSAVNQDGRSNGLMAPNPAAQIAVLRSACANAGVQPRDIDYVEAHGTGTLLGDPIEARALGTVYGRGRPQDAPLLIGALKTNLGHLEAAAGIAGFIKATLALDHAHIPPNLHFESPNPHIAFPEMRLKVVAEHTDWPSTGRPRRAGVSSFGFGGTNAHVVLEQAPQTAALPAVTPAVPAAAVCTLTVSGKTPARVASLAGTLADWMAGAGADVSLADVAHTLNHHRARHPRFATVCAADRDEAIAGLQALAAGVPGPGVVPTHAGGRGPGTVFVYSGQGSQWPGMGRRLLADEPVFAAAIAELEPPFSAELGFSLQSVLAGGQPVAGDVQVQSVIFGMQLALTALWRSYGVEPDALIGHSMGEVTAAVVSGALTVAEGFRVIGTRSRLMSRLAGLGAVAMVELDAASTEKLIADYPQLSITVYASPRQTVFAGPTDQVEAVLLRAQQQDVFARRVNMEVPSHHAMMEPVLPEIRTALADLAPRPTDIPVITTAVENGSASTPFDADYWAANVRNPVRFAEAVAEAAADHSTFIEISPHPILTHAISDTVGDPHHHSIGTLARDTSDTLTFHTNLNSTHTTHPPRSEHPPEPHPALPSTPWHHASYWLAGKSDGAVAGSAPRPGTLLGQQLTVSVTPAVHLWHARLVPEAKPYRGSHRVGGVEVVPVSVLLQTLLTAASHVGASALSDVRFVNPIVVDQPKVIHVVADGESVTVTSSSAADAPADRWTRHVSARLAQSSSAPGGVVEGPILEMDAVDASIAEMLVGVGTSIPDGAEARLFVPASIAEVRIGAPLADGEGSVAVRRLTEDDGDLVVDLDISGVSLRSLRLTALEPTATQAPADDARLFAHVVDWQPRTDTDNVARAAGTIAVVGADGGAGAQLRDQLRGAGHPSADPADARYVMYLADTETAYEGETDLEAAVRISADVTELVKQLTQRDERDPVSLWILTTGVREAATRAAVRQSCLWGLAGVIPAEQPEIWGGLVDLEAGYAPDGVGTAIAEVLSQPSKTVLALRDGVFLAPAMVPLTGEPQRGELRCRPEAAYLITGGLGALGLLMAGWLADAGARRVLLAGRTPLPPRRDWPGITEAGDPQIGQRISAIRELEQRGVSVEVVTLDVGSRADIDALLTARDEAGAPPIRGVIHAAGVTHDELVTSISAATLRQVMWPKIAGAQALHEAFPCGSLDFLYLTASAGGLFGIPGQGTYAAANAHLDGLARARHRDGCHTVSIDWAAWQGLGFAADAAIVAHELARLGSRELTSTEAFTAWEHLHRFDIAQAVVLPVSSPVERDLTMLDGQLSGATAAAWSQMSRADLREQLLCDIGAVVARELRIADGDLDTDRPFVELGLNSMMALSIRRDLERLVGLELSATMLWNHPTVAALSTYLAGKLAAPEIAPAAAAREPDEAGGILDSLFDSVESTTTVTETGIW